MLCCLHFQLKLSVVCVVEGTADLFSEDFQCCFHLGLPFPALGRCSCKKEEKVFGHCITIKKINKQLGLEGRHEYKYKLSSNTVQYSTVITEYKNSNGWVS